MERSRARALRSLSRRSGASWQEMRGVDLTVSPGWRDELRHEGRGTDVAGGVRAQLSAGGFVSPMGFRFSTVASPTDAVEGLRITWHARFDRSEIRGAESRQRARGAIVRRVPVPTPSPRHGEATLVVGTEGADVFASEMAWEALAEPVLLVVEQYVRYGAIERRLVAMQDQAQRDGSRTTVAGLHTFREHGSLISAACDVRGLISDWAYFSGPVADPRRACSSEESLEAYENVAEALGIDDWGEGIEELATNLEQTYDAVTDRLFHYRLFLYEMTMEIIIALLIFGLFYIGE